MQRVTVIGLGLIGGSIGLGLKRWSAQNAKGGQDALQVTGFDTDLEQQHYAKKINAVDKTEWNLINAVKNADIVILATPVLAAKEVMTDIAEHLQAGALVTDAGSTKAQIVQWADEILPRTVSFVGGHPMAGKSQSIEAAEADLFTAATWCVCPSVHAGEEAIRNALGIIAALGAEPYFVDPSEHDAFVAGVSHLPFVLSAALMRAVSADSSWRDMKTLSSSGFRDTSRLAGGSPSMHRDIVITNREAVTRWIDSYVEALQGLREKLNDGNETMAEDVFAFFDGARDARAEWATQTNREGELLQSTDNELSGAGNISDQLGRMLLGGLAKNRRSLFDRNRGMSSGKNGRDPRRE